MKTEYLIDREVQQILGLLTDGNRLAISVALHTGLRISDVLELKRAQLGKQFWVTEKKTGKRKQVGLPKVLLDEVLQRSTGSEWAFPGAKPGTHRTRQAVWKDVKRAAAAYRIRVNAAPHSFRKVYAVDLLHKYGDVKKVQRALNHHSPTLTLVYAMADLSLKTRRSRRAAASRRA